MSKKYIVKQNNHSVEMTKPNSTILVYRIPYRDVERKRIGFTIANPFIVYILYGKNNQGKDMIYVGKSKNGLANRPTAHKNKFDDWTTCYVLTQFMERTFFNDGAIQYLEDQLNHRIQEVGVFNNTTVTTTSGTANDDDIEDCDNYLDEVYSMLEVLGLDLITNSEEDVAEKDMESAMSDAEARAKIPEGEYYLARKIKRLDNAEYHGIMLVSNGKFILKAGSEITPDEGTGLAPNVQAMRNEARIEEGILMEDVTTNSPSACGEFITGAACNGWTNWKLADGRPIDIYRK